MCEWKKIYVDGFGIDSYCWIAIAVPIKVASSSSMGIVKIWRFAPVKMFHKVVASGLKRRTFAGESVVQNTFAKKLFYETLSPMR